MRVKEGGNTNLEMGKKKKNKVTDYHNTSDEETLKNKGCSHKDSSFNFQGVKKGLKNASNPLGTCQQCHSAVKKGTSEEDAGDSPFEPTVWICLQCGHQGCDRNSQEKHALTHYETPRSGSHALALSFATWQVWCYKCDDEVPSSDWKKFVECSDWLKKQLGVSKSDRLGFSSKKKGKEKDADKEEDRKQKSTPNPVEKNSASSKVKGLVNLGNTCFFNAVMQNLTQTHVLRSVLSEKWAVGKQVDIPLDTHLDLEAPNDEDKSEEDGEETSHLMITLPSMGSLTSALLGFLEDVNKESKNSSVNPRPLFSEVCQKAARFKGYQQQDSHELLRYLLDSMRNEQIKRIQEGILNTFNIKDKDKSKINKLDENTKKKIREYGLKGKMTFVDGVFGGYLISSVKCQVCNTVSEILEPFLDLSLPILEAKGSKKGSFSGRNPERPQTLAEQAKLAEQESDDLSSPGATAPSKMSKHQQQKAREKTRKEIKRKNKKSRSHSQSSEKGPEVAEEGESPSHSDNEDGKDPNDADSETSMMERNGSNQNDEGTATEDTLDSNNAIGNVAVETDSKSKVNATSEGGTGDKESSKEKTIEEKEDAKLKGGANQDSKFTEEESSIKGPLSSEGTVKESEEKDKVEELTSELSRLTINGSTSNLETQAREDVSKDADEEEKGHGDKKKVETETIQSNCAVDQDNSNTALREDGESTPTNVNSVSPAVQRKTKRPPPLIAPPPAPCITPTKSPPLSPLSPSIKAKATSPLGPRYHAKSQECSVQSCLSQFTSPEWLTGANKFGCENCTAKKGKDADGKSKTQYTDASKQLLIHHPPPILTLHLKRFQQVGYSLRKITRHIDFPLVLDLSPFCSESCQKFANKDGQVLYALYGIVEHSGRLQFGHYTSFIKVRQPSQNLYLHTLKIPRSLNLLQAANATCSKKTTGAEKKRHPKSMGNSVFTESLTNHAQPNGVLPTGEHVTELDSQGSQWGHVTPNHHGNTPENGISGASHFPMASGEKGAHPKGKWYYISDTHVSEATESKVLNAQAYLLFYERIL
ncbi:Ubiquitin carboxyl-terminal hydrolase 16 [Holothuria leucospilota]|uniref:Ubiquitin carboxyl-terminal hydrolase 16 n=1 Tax=Holothuria leucospilota TaxID=206669 RepID=A0A9Q1BHQ9_HOLLE|nr:Ubiquitin carboxyl-terminal hydrolase 16 [Holothuria leucospilota]